MEDYKLAEICFKFVEKLGDDFSSRIERSMGQNIKQAVEQRPKEVLIRILQDIYSRYVCPYEMTDSVSEYLKTFGIDRFSLAFSPNYDYPLSEKTEDAKSFVKQFYEMVEALGFKETIIKNNEKPWKNEQ